MQHLQLFGVVREEGNALDAHDRLVADLLDVEDVGHRHQPVAHGTQLLGALEAELAARLHVDLDRADGPFLTSSAKRLALMVWKLPSGQTVASGSFIAACARPIAGRHHQRTGAAFKAVLRPNFIGSPLRRDRQAPLSRP